MPSTITPSWSNLSVLAITTVANNAVSRSTMDLSAKWGAWVYVQLGRGGTTALPNGVDVLVARTGSAGGILIPGYLVALLSQTAAAVGTTCTAAGSPNNAGVGSLTVASTTSFAVGDIICIQDNATPTSLTEWNRVARVTSATVLLLDSPTLFAHNNTAHTVRNKAESWSFWLDGGEIYEIILDRGQQGTGEAVTAQINARLLDSVAAS
jgi:hypothetical protein